MKRNFLAHTTEGSPMDQFLNIYVKLGESQKGVEVQFHVRSHTAPVSFEVKFNTPFKRVVKGFSEDPHAGVGSCIEEIDGCAYRICVPSKKITTDNFFVAHFLFEGKKGKCTWASGWEDGLKK